MAKVRVMFIGQGASLLPEDRFINVFHFAQVSAMTGAQAVDAAIPLVEEFYEAATAGGSSVGNMLSNYVVRGYELRGYDLEEPEPRIPVIVPNTLPVALGGGLPEEVAVCLSLQGDPPITPRRRGRLYIGPLCRSALTFVDGSITAPARPAGAAGNELLPTLIAAAQRLKASSIAANLQWCIRSTLPVENFVPVISGYVDNAFDTQRRRGPAATSRQVF